MVPESEAPVQRSTWYEDLWCPSTMNKSDTPLSGVATGSSSEWRLYRTHTSAYWEALQVMWTACSWTSPRVWSPTTWCSSKMAPRLVPSWPSERTWTSFWLGKILNPTDDADFNCGWCDTHEATGCRWISSTWRFRRSSLAWIQGSTYEDFWKNLRVVRDKKDYYLRTQTANQNRKWVLSANQNRWHPFSATPSDF